MNYLIIYTIVISTIIPAMRSFILDVYGGMVAWDYMHGGRRFNCPLQKKKNEKDKKIPVLDVSHFLKEAKQNYNDLKNYNDERERQRQAEAERQRQAEAERQKQAEAERQRQQREQEERDRQEKIKKQKLEQERIEIENRKKQEAERQRLEEEKRLQLIREQLRSEEERKRQEFLLLQQARERDRIIEEIERLKKIINQQQSGFVDKVQSDWKPPNESGSSERCSARIPDDRDDDDAWRDYIFDWNYDHCIITSYA